MTHGRNLITTMLLAATIIFISSRASDAQDQSPSPRMLLNLDLFTAPPGDKPPGPPNAAGTSTLEQLRALRAMGYLNADGPPPDDDSAEASDTPKPVVQKSQGAQQ
jgi:hypothetical protein